ncbi:hypothetical protein [Streptomyces sp. NPDC056938]|uniref:hypothetical protein n=1 Tax=Streptomyces sp. NPDC056938 TaxID=3345970 RepID=UPI003632864B
MDRAHPVTGGRRQPAVLRGTVLGALVVGIVAPVVRLRRPGTALSAPVDVRHR